MEIKEKYLTNDFFLAYKAKRKKKKTLKGVAVKKADYTKIIKEYYDAVSKMIVYDSYSHYNSHKMGCINVLKYEAVMLDKEGNLRESSLAVDWKATKAMWAEKYNMEYDVEKFKLIKDKPLIYFDNDHSDGWKYRWNWDKRTSLMNHQSKYYFRASRHNKRFLANAVKTIPSLDFSERVINTNLK